MISSLNLDNELNLKMQIGNISGWKWQRAKYSISIDMLNSFEFQLPVSILVVSDVREVNEK